MENLPNQTGYKKLILYKKAKDLVILVYKITDHFPKTELYGLIPQIRRAAISIVSNIVEGYSKDSSAEYARFLTISIGSLTELEVQLEISMELDFIDKENWKKVFDLLTEVKKLLYVSRKSIRSRVS